MQFSHIVAFVATLALTVSAAPTPDGHGSGSGDTTTTTIVHAEDNRCSIKSQDTQVCCNSFSGGSSASGLLGLAIPISLLSNFGCGVNLLGNGCEKTQQTICCGNQNGLINNCGNLVSL